MSIAGKLKAQIFTNDAEAWGRLDRTLRKFCAAENEMAVKVGAAELDTGRLRPPADAQIPIYSWMAEIEVPDNLNFWFQLKALPKILTPYFWKKTADELEAERRKLIAGDAWAYCNWEKLSATFNARVCVRESYDWGSAAESRFFVDHGRDDEKLCWLGSGPMPDHAATLRRCIADVKAMAAAVKAAGTFNGNRVENVTVNKDQYWGMFD